MVLFINASGSSLQVDMKKTVKVKPNSKTQLIEEMADGTLKVNLKSPPVDGKANKELIKLLAEKFNVTKSQIQIKSGLSSKTKLIEIVED
jgi:uncharacterized protein (TIGR00251 family)